MGRIRRDQLPTALVFGLGLVVVVGLAVVDPSPFAWLVVVVFGAAAWWSWPGRRGRHVPHAEALAAAGDDDVIVYWRPG